MSGRVYREDEIGYRLLLVVNRVLLRFTYFAWLAGVLFLFLLLWCYCLITFQRYKLACESVSLMAMGRPRQTMFRVRAESSIACKYDMMVEGRAWDHR